MNETFVSLIMPIKNLERYIAETVQSIIQQSHQHWELLIVNDHSTDGTDDIITALAERDQRIKLYQNEGNGIIPALQLALSKTKGEYISRFDGDDIMPPDRLGLMMKACLAAPPKTIVTGKVKYFSDEPISNGYLAYEQWLNERIDQNDHWDWRYRECVIASPNWMVRKSDLLEMGGFNQLSYPEDYDLVLQWHRHRFKVKSIPETTLNWREHPERTSRNSEHYNQEHFFRLKIKHFVRHQLGNSKLVIWGTDTKGKLTANILDELLTGFTWMGLEERMAEQQINLHQIHHYTEIEGLKNIKLLLAVYPNNEQRAKLENYLQNQYLVLGEDYWYL